EAGGDGLEVDGLEAVGFFGGEAGVTQEIAVAGGVDEEGGGDGAASGAVLDHGGGDAGGVAGGGDAAGGEEDADGGVFADELVELGGEFGAVEAELAAVDGGDFLERAAAAEAFDDFKGEAADDGAGAGGVVDGVPFVDLGGDGHAAEQGGLLDEGDGEAEAGGAHGGEDSGAGTADDAEVGLMADGGVAGGFVDAGRGAGRGHGSTMRREVRRLKAGVVEQSNHVMEKTHDRGAGFSGR